MLKRSFSCVLDGPRPQCPAPNIRKTGFNTGISIVSKLLQMQHDPLASLSTKQHAMNYPMRDEEVTEDEKLPKGIECVLKDGVAKAESGGKINCGALSSSKKAPRNKTKSTRQKDIREQEKLADHIDYILKDDTTAAEKKEQISPGKISASLKTRRFKKSSIRDKGITEEEKLADDIKYILNDNIPAVETKEQVSSAKASSSQKARRAKKKSTRDEDIREEKKLADDIDSILNDEVTVAASIGQVSSGRCPTTKKVRPPKKCSTKKKNSKTTRN